jgi:hypothetical protein
MTEAIGRDGMAGSRTLSHYIEELQQEGYRLTASYCDTVQMVKPKRFSVLWAALWLLFFGVGIMFYAIYFVAKRDDTAYLEERDGYVRGYVEYTRVRTGRLLIGVGLSIVGFVMMLVGGSANSGPTIIVGFLIWLIGGGFQIASLFGWRRHKEIGLAEASPLAETDGGVA